MDNLITIKLENFNLKLLDNLLSESLMVNNQLMLEFKDNMVKSCSFSSTKSLIKLWTNPIDNFRVKKTAEKDELDVTVLDKLIENDKPFNLGYDFDFYILKGDLFKKYLSVFKDGTVNLEFTIKPGEANSKFQATSIKIEGRSENKLPLTTTFPLTTEELISNTVSDYSEILSECTPPPTMLEFLMNANYVKELKSLVKNLHHSTPDNTAFLAFEITSEKIVIKDKVFSIEIKNDIEIQTKNKMNNLKEEDKLFFNVLKSDFVILGEHVFTIYTEQDSQKVIFGTLHHGAIIWCLSTKITKQENSTELDDDAEIDSLDMSSYNFDDL